MVKLDLKVVHAQNVTGLILQVFVVNKRRPELSNMTKAMRMTAASTVGTLLLMTMGCISSMYFQRSSMRLSGFHRRAKEAWFISFRAENIVSEFEMIEHDEWQDISQIVVIIF